ncbi:transcriptional regulatory protein AlgP-like, partial [Amphibalanus amphitrite]|uniref:transcriptional regulatory protein AlgP-like n=1 Tax=Amphibalanus amphitrite TaxID=1232801 RepID=UPI001C910DAA
MVLKTMKCKIPRPPGIPRLAGPGRGSHRGKPAPMSAPPVDAGRRAPPPPPTAAGSDGGAAGRLACSLQSLRGRLSRGRAPDTVPAPAAAAAAAAATASPAAAAGRSEGPPAAAAQTSDRRPQEQSGSRAPSASSEGGKTRESGDQNSDASDAHPNGAAGSTARGDESVRDSVADDARKSENSGVSKSSGAPRAGSLGSTEPTTQPSATRADSVPAQQPAAVAGSSTEAPAVSDSSSASSTTSPDTAPEKPHVCGSFFSPCCSARRAGGGVKTFSGASATSTGASASTGAPTARHSGSERHRSPVSLARILSRPVFTSSPPPPARKKSSVVYFHPEFQPGVIGEDDATDSSSPRSQMPSRSMGNTSSSGAASPQPRSPTFRPRVTLPPDYEYMKKLVPELK